MEGGGVLFPETLSVGLSADCRTHRLPGGGRSVRSVDVLFVADVAIDALEERVSTMLWDQGHAPGEHPFEPRDDRGIVGQAHHSFFHRTDCRIQFGKGRVKLAALNLNEAGHMPDQLVAGRREQLQFLHCMIYRKHLAN
jgi:hypothetical protein